MARFRRVVDAFVSGECPLLLTTQTQPNLSATHIRLTLVIMTNIPIELSESIEDNKPT